MNTRAAKAIKHALAVRTPGPAAGKHPNVNINPNTGLSTDYLNHFTEAMMLLEIAAMMPDCLDDLRAWRPKTYGEHFASSSFSDRATVIAAYEAADPAVRGALDATSETLNTVLVEACDVVLQHLGRPAGDALAQRAVAWVKPLIARAAAVINGTNIVPGGSGTQAAVDALFER
jgi:hypothetical protein